MIIVSNIILSSIDHHLFDAKQWWFSQTSSCHCLTIIYLMLFNDVSPQHILSKYNNHIWVTVVNEDRQAGKTKVGVQIVARIWQEKAAAQPSLIRDASAGTNSNNNNHFMTTPRHFFSLAFSGYRTSSTINNIYSKPLTTQIVQIRESLGAKKQFRKIFYKPFK